MTNAQYLDNRFKSRWSELATIAKQFGQMPLKRTDKTVDDVRTAVKDNDEADGDLLKHFERGNLRYV